jgi:hypothetical protein
VLAFEVLALEVLALEVLASEVLVHVLPPPGRKQGWRQTGSLRGETQPQGKG